MDKMDLERRKYMLGGEDPILKALCDLEEKLYLKPNFVYIIYLQIINLNDKL